MKTGPFDLDLVARTADERLNDTSLASPKAHVRGLVLTPQMPKANVEIKILAIGFKPPDDAGCSANCTPSN